MRIESHFSFSGGTNFFPAVAESKTGLRFAHKEAPGDIAKHGRHRGQPVKSGWATWIPDGYDYAAAKAAINLLKDKLGLLNDCGVEHTIYTLNIFCDLDEEQCNLELPPDFMQTLIELKLSLGISVYTEKSGND